MQASDILRRSTGVAAAIAIVGGSLGSMTALGVPAASGATTHWSEPLTVPEVIASGLAAPRHISVGPDGDLYVALAGTGGTSCVSGRTQGSYCLGLTGAVDRVTPKGAVTTVLNGLPSIADTTEGAGPPDYLGPAAVDYVNGVLSVVMEDDDLNPDGTNGLGPDGADLGQIVTALPFSSAWDWRAGPNFAAYAAQHPQTASSLGLPPASYESPTDSDPYDITPYDGGYAVVDAAANALLWVSPFGQIRSLASFPAEQSGIQAVPTAVAVGPDHALYIGELGGATGTDLSTEVVYRVVPGATPTVYATGFTTISALAFDRFGHLLVLEYNTSGLTSPTGSGALVEIGQNGAQTTLASTLNDPTGVAVGFDGALYVSNNGDSPTAGQILRIADQ
jgi:hypothetical protein